MSDIETGEQAETFFGDKLYQKRARAALPLLVRQAKAQQTIYYADLAEELGMPNPRNLNYVLGSIGESIIQAGKERGEVIPPIQCVVVNQSDGLPGEGVGFFLGQEDYKAMSKRQRRLVVDAHLLKVFGFTKWDAVLAAFSMQPVTSDFSQFVQKAAESGRGGGESEHHKKLKAYVAAHPETIGLPKSLSEGSMEYPLPSGDALDILFRERDEWIGVEVKSDISDDVDLARGLYQCVKYRAVLEAYLIATARVPNVRTVLVTTRSFPLEMVPLRNVLGVTVIQTAIPANAI